MERLRRVGNPVLHKIIQCFLVVVCLLLWACPGSVWAAADTEVTTVKVGYFFDGDFMDKDSKGAYRGYNVEYLYEIANYANWQYEFVNFHGFDEAYAALKAGDIDVLPGIFKSPEREKELLFSNEDMGRVYVTLVTAENDERYAYDDYPSFQGMRVGTLAATLDNTAFREWSAEKGITTRITEYSSEEDLFEALDKGVLDAVAITFLGNSSKYRIIAEFKPMTMYFALTRGREPLKKMLDESMNRIYINNSSFQNRLYDKYFSMSNGMTPVFSLKEKEFIARGKPVRVVLQVDNGPFCFEDGQGNLIGVIPDLYQKIAELSGLKFTYVKAQNMKEAIQMVENGQADVIAKMTGNSVLAAASGLRMSRPFMDIGLTQISLKGSSEVHTVGIPDPLRSSFPEEVLSSEGRPLKVVSFSSSKACFEALRAGTIDMAYINSATANYLLNLYRSSDYNFSSIPGRSYNLATGIRNDESNELYDIINKCLRYVDSSMLISLSVKYSLSGESSLKAFINRLPADILLMVSAVLACMVMGLIALVVTTVRKVRVERALVLERGKIQRQNQKILLEEQANTERMRFFSTVNHDMRTPLNGVLGYTDLAMDERDMGKIQDYLSKIRISGRILLQLINDILDFGQFTSRSLILQPGPVDMGTICADVETIIKPLAVNKKLTFRMVRLSPYAGYVEGDALRLQQIFINLLSNSVKFTNPGGTVEAVVEERSRADSVDCTITVRDTGIGMSAAFLPKIFDTYAQERRPSASPMAGTGLGMTIVKQIVDTMGGTIHVDSVIDKGSVFTVQLRLKKYAAGKAAPSAAKAPASLDILQGRRVLLCEDNELNAEIAQAILKQWGMDVRWVENGAEAVAAVEQSSPKPYEIILMDKRMPVMDGVAATKAIRHMERAECRSIPILAMTGDIFPDAVQECLDAGMNGCVGKPVDRQQLAKAMIELLA